MESLPLTIHLYGQPPRKSNARQVVYRTRRTSSGEKTRIPMVIKGAKAQKWVRDALKQITGDKRLGVGSARCPLKITFHVYYKTKRPDLSIELILDTLEEAGVISNDRHVYETHAYKRFTKYHPGVDIFIEEADPPKDDS